MKSQNREILYGLYDDDADLLKAVKAANKEHLDIQRFVLRASSPRDPNCVIGADFEILRDADQGSVWVVGVTRGCSNIAMATERQRQLDFIIV